MRTAGRLLAAALAAAVTVVTAGADLAWSSPARSGTAWQGAAWRAVPDRAVATGAAGPVTAGPPAATPSPARSAPPSADRRAKAQQAPTAEQAVGARRAPRQRRPGRAAQAPRVVLRPDRLDLLGKGGRPVGALPFDGRDTTLGRIAEAVAGSRRPGWITEVRRGVFELRATLVQAPSTRLVVAAPDVREVRLALPGAGIRGRGARARFVGVKVTSWDQATRGPLRDPTGPRPAIAYTKGANLRVVRAELAWLGTTRPHGDTGVTWSASSGAVIASRFHHNAAGAKLLRGSRVTVDRSAFDHNAGHGLLVSDASAASTVRRSLARRNGGDGIVLAGVHGALVRANTVRGNRVGVRVGRRGAGARVEANLIAGNQVGIEVYDGARHTALERNVVTGSTRAGIVLEGVASTSRADRVRDTPVAIEVREYARLVGTAVAGSARGIVVGARGIARIERARVASSAVALDIGAGSLVRLRRSWLRAPEPITGADPLEATGNDLGPPPAPPAPASPPPTPWLALAGIAFVSLAVLLQAVHRARNRAPRREKEARGALDPT